MEIIDYKLKSNPEINVKVPSEYGKKADDLINIALKEGDDGLKKVSPEHPYLQHVGVFGRTKALVKEKSKRLQDILYLRICVWGNEQELKNNFSEEIVQMNNNLIRKIEWLESCRDN